MKGSVRKRGSTWSYYFDLGKVDGKRKRKEKGGFKTKKEAEAALAAAMNEFNGTGLVFEPSELTLSEYLDQWYEMYCVPNLRYRTLKHRKDTIELHLKPDLGFYKLKALSPAIMQKYANSFQETEYAYKTIDDIISTLKSALNYAVEPLRYIQQNPMIYVKIPRIDRQKRERIVLTLEQWERINERFLKMRYHIPLMIGYYCGLRISETIALTWDCVDLDARTLTVEKQVQYQKHGDEDHYSMYLTKPKSKDSMRTISFGQTLAGELSEWRNTQKKNEQLYRENYAHYRAEPVDLRDVICKIAKCDKKEENLHFVCTSKTGTLVQQESFSWCTKVAREQLGIPFDYHCLRHTHATMLVAAGANMKTIQKRLGHSNIQTTMQTYAHATEEMDQDAAEIFEKASKKDPTVAN